MANYVANGGTAAGGGPRPFLGCGVGSLAPGDASVVAAWALAAYDASAGSTDPDLLLAATSGDVLAPLLSFEARAAGAPPASSTTPWEALGPRPAPVRFTATGSGEASVAAALTFVPAAPADTAGPVYRGLYVEKVVRAMDANGRAVGPALRYVELGASVVVTIQVTTPDDLSRVILEDLSAGGLEPVDPNVAGDNAGSDESDNCGGGGGWYRWSWWCVAALSYRQTYADRVTWQSGSTLRAGSHSVSYQAVAATRGVWTVPPARAYVIDQQEVLGLSQGSTVVIAGAYQNNPLDGSPVAAPTAGITVAPPRPTPDAAATGAPPVVVIRSFPKMDDRSAVVSYLRRVLPEAQASFVATRAAPRSCPGGCPLGGVCQLATGTCMCQRGYELVPGDCAPTAAPTEAPPSPAPTEAPSSSAAPTDGACADAAAAVAACEAERGGWGWTCTDAELLKPCGEGEALVGDRCATVCDDG